MKDLKYLKAVAEEEVDIEVDKLVEEDHFSYTAAMSNEIYLEIIHFQEYNGVLTT